MFRVVYNTEVSGLNLSDKAIAYIESKGKSADTIERHDQVLIDAVLTLGAEVCTSGSLAIQDIEYNSYAIVPRLGEKVLSSPYKWVSIDI